MIYQSHGVRFCTTSTFTLGTCTTFTCNGVLTDEVVGCDALGVEEMICILVHTLVQATQSVNTCLCGIFEDIKSSSNIIETL